MEITLYNWTEVFIHSLLMHAAIGQYMLRKVLLDIKLRAVDREATYLSYSNKALQSASTKGSSNEQVKSGCGKSECTVSCAATECWS